MSLIAFFLFCYSYSYADHDHNQCSLDDPEIVGMRPGSVLLIDQVEKASMSVFSGLIALLDYRILTDRNQSCTIHLSDTVIIIVSDLGNMDFIVEMFEAYEGCRTTSKRTTLGALDNKQQPDSRVRGFQQVERSRFRFELLNRVGEVVFFNPDADDQLTNFARFSTREGPHLMFGKAFKKLFDESNFQVSYL